MLILCKQCSQHYQRQETSCPHCTLPRARHARISSMLLLGIGLSACGEKTADTADTASSDTATEPIEPADAPEYGVEAVDNAEETLFLDDENTATEPSVQATQ